jgi:DinB family protein
MKTPVLCFLCAAAMAGGLYAQNANPLSTELLQSYTIVKTNLVKMAQRMPEQAYSYKPTPEVETFARRVAHIAGANFRTCAGLKGETKSLNLAGKTAKSDLVAALEESFSYCDAVFNALTDQTAVEMVNGRIGSPPTPDPRTRLSTMWNVVRHSNELYGYMSVYLRLNGVVPPSTSPD